MTKKHFKAIAEIIRNTRCVKEIAQVAIKLADYFADENPLFDRDKFMTACGL